MASDQKRISFLVFGRVQGVNYRRYAKKQALSYDLRGWVRNTDDAKVEGEAQGKPAQLQKFVKDLKIGPPAAKVAKVEQNEMDLKDGEASFTQAD